MGAGSSPPNSRTCMENINGNDKMLELNKIYCGDCLEVMRTWPDAFVDCCVTSPPYWNLRDYGIEGQLGLEPTIYEFVEKMMTVFGEVFRVLKPEGTLWLNLGDSYNSGLPGSRNPKRWPKQSRNDHKPSSKPMQPELKVKDLCGIPWRVAFALQASGWYLRQDIIWHKPNPMPESVRDRCTKAHEYIFLMSKNKKYYYDCDAIKEEAVESNASRPRMGQGPNTQYNQKRRDQDRAGSYGEHGSIKHEASNAGTKTKRFGSDPEMRNKRDVWTVPLAPFPEAHFATFPPALIEPCILAGCPEGGLVLDPFMGSGTTAMVAYENRRNHIGCELNPEYIKLNRADKAKEKYGLFEA